MWLHGYVVVRLRGYVAGPKRSEDVHPKRASQVRLRTDNSAGLMDTALMDDGVHFTNLDVGDFRV